jgi:hypothetical protein
VDVRMIPSRPIVVAAGVVGRSAMVLLSSMAR